MTSKNVTILEGIRDRACKNVGRDPNDRTLRVKFGGGRLDGSAENDDYISIQNIDMQVKSKAAKQKGLIRRTYAILSIPGEERPRFRVREWDGSKDGETDDYRVIWEALADAKGQNELLKIITADLTHFPTPIDS